LSAYTESGGHSQRRKRSSCSFKTNSGLTSTSASALESSGKGSGAAREGSATRCRASWRASTSGGSYGKYWHQLLGNALGLNRKNPCPTAYDGAVVGI